MTERDKLAVAQSFSRAADSYDSVAALQRSVGADLLQLLQQHLPAAVNDQSARARIVDLGSGTGYFSEQLAQQFTAHSVIGLDIAHGMLRYARAHRAPAISWLGGDMEALPLAAQSVQVFFSSLAVQWCENLPAFFAEVTRCLAPGGVLALATLGPETLCELRDSWRAVDSYTHVNRFTPIDAVQSSARTSGLQELHRVQAPRVMHYPTLRELTHELKALGAHNVNHQRAPGLTAPAKIKRLREAYENYRTDQGLPASYQVCWLLLQKPVYAGGGL